MGKGNEDFEIVDKSTVSEINEELQFVSAKLLPKVEELTAGTKGLIAELRNVKKEVETPDEKLPQLSEPQQGEIRKQILLLVKSIKKGYEEEYKKKIAESIADVNTTKDTMLNKMDYELAKKLAKNSLEDKKISKTLGELKEQMGKLGQNSSPEGKDFSKEISALDGKIDAILKITKKYEENFEKTLDLVEELAKAPAVESTDKETLDLIMQKLEKLDSIDKDAATIKHNANILVDRTGTGFKSFGLFIGGAIAMFVFFAASGKISISF